MCWRCCVVVDWLRWFKTTKEQTMRGYNEIEIKRKQSDYRSSVDFVDWCQIVSMRFWVSSTSLYLLQHFSILTEPQINEILELFACAHTHTRTTRICCLYCSMLMFSHAHGLVLGEHTDLPITEQIITVFNGCHHHYHSHSVNWIFLIEFADARQSLSNVVFWQHSSCGLSPNRRNNV